MFRLIGVLVVLVSGFGLGYYASQHRVEDLQRGIATISHALWDTAKRISMTRDVEWQAGLVQAKASVVEAKSEALDRNFGNASRELVKAADSLHAASRVERDSERAAAARRLAAEVRKTGQVVAQGKPVSQSRLDHFERGINSLLER